MSTLKCRIITIGTDVEVFVRDKETKEIKAASLAGMLVGSSKHNATKIPLHAGGYLTEFSTHPDNIALEWQSPICNLDSPKFRVLIPIVMEDIGHRLGLDNLEIVPEVTEALFDVGTLMGMPGSTEFGCNPDTNIYTGKSSDMDSISPWRFCGGHIHVGLQPGWDMEDVGKVVNYLDRTLGKYMIELCKKHGQTQRMGVYGKLGTIRVKPYGFEYRVPSNLWVFNLESIETVHKILADVSKNVI